VNLLTPLLSFRVGSLHMSSTSGITSSHSTRFVGWMLQPGIWPQSTALKDWIVVGLDVAEVLLAVLAARSVRVRKVGALPHDVSILPDMLVTYAPSLSSHGYHQE
jgi:hypothetical protein